jgi:hypothetical protein
MPDVDVQSDTMFAIKARASTLSYKSKTDTFTTSARKAVAILKEIGSKDLSRMNDSQHAFLNGFVAGTVVGITPTDAAHINPTFAFCKSLKLKEKRVASSIGDGCYRSLQRFSEDDDVKRRLRANGRDVMWITPASRPKPLEKKACPYFHIGGKAFECPFAQAPKSDAYTVYEICSHDDAHP